MPKAPKAAVGARKPVHPNSRQALQLQRQSHHDQKVLKTKSETTAKQDQLRQKLAWFQENMNQNKIMYTKHELAELGSRYLERFEDELEQIGIVNSVGNRQAKQHVSREAAIKITLEREKREYEGAGLEVPDLVNGKNLEQFRNWTGEAKYCQNIKMRKTRSADLENSKQKDNVEEELPDYIESDTDLKDNSVESEQDLPDYVESD